MTAEQTTLFGEAERDGGGFISAFGKRLHVEQFAEVYGIDAQTIRSRLRSGWSNERSVSEAYTSTNKRLSTAFQVPWFSPGSFTWDHLPYELDIGCQDFVKKHPGGALVEECCEAYGIEDSQLRGSEASALMKLRGAVLDDSEGARSLFIDMLGEDALELLLERYGKTAPDMEGAGPSAEADEERDDGELFAAAA